MNKSRFDYDASGVATHYDLGRDHGPGLVQLWMRAIESGLLNPEAMRVALDVGCGTGRFIGGLADHFHVKAIGIDLSRQMLAQARGKYLDDRFAFAAGRAEALPIPDHAIDLVFMSMVFHHFDDPLRAATECRRVLRPGGTAFLRAGTVDRIPLYAYVPFFPEALPLLHEVLAPASAIRETFEGAGFRTASEDLLVQEIAPTHAEYAAKLSVGADSVLARLTPGQLEEGLGRLRAHAARVDPRPVSEPIDFFVFV